MRPWESLPLAFCNQSFFLHSCSPSPPPGTRPSARASIPSPPLSQRSRQPQIWTTNPPPLEQNLGKERLCPSRREAAIAPKERGVVGEGNLDGLWLRLTHLSHPQANERPEEHFTPQPRRWLFLLPPPSRNADINPGKPCHPMHRWLWVQAPSSQENLNIHRKLHSSALGKGPLSGGGVKRVLVHVP